MRKCENVKMKYRDTEQRIQLLDEQVNKYVAHLYSYSNIQRNAEAS